MIEVISKPFNVEQDLKEVTLFLENKKRKDSKIPNASNAEFKTYSGLYGDATEDITSYSPILGKMNSYLTTCSSGDQAINSILNGATNITTFDCNKLTKYALSLKIAALKALDRKEFIQFYNEFSKTIFEKIIPFLEGEDKEFWTYIFTHYPTTTINTKLFNRKRLEKSLTIRINPYLKGTQYAIVKEKIEDIHFSFLESDIYDLPKQIEGSFDGINLSNIYEYLNFGLSTSAKNAQRYMSLINQLRKHLTDQGTMLIAYLYGFDSYTYSFVKEIFKKNPNYLRQITKPYNTQEELELIKRGLTWQNYAYALLYDEALKQGATPHSTMINVDYGISTANQDMVLSIKKGK